MQPRPEDCSYNLIMAVPLHALSRTGATDTHRDWGGWLSERALPAKLGLTDYASATSRKHSSHHLFDVFDRLTLLRTDPMPACQDM